MLQTLFSANIKLPEGRYVLGMVTTADNEVYNFINSDAEADIFFSVKRNEQLKWQANDDRSDNIPNVMINQLGNLIDYHQSDPYAIELLADNLLPGYIPQNNEVTDISFDLPLAPDFHLQVYYSKMINNFGEEVWEYRKSKVIYR